MKRCVFLGLLAVLGFAAAMPTLFAASAPPNPKGSQIVPASEVTTYRDARPSAPYRLDARDAGVVLRHGEGPGDCDRLGARDVWVYEAGGKFYMTYDGAGPRAWLACLAVSGDLEHWTRRGPVLDLGAAGEGDSASASYGTTFFDGARWHMFYLGTPHVSPAPNLVPSFPYLTMKATGSSPEGPWTKQRAVNPYDVKPGTFYSVTASPGFIVRQGDEYLMFFSAAMSPPTKRTIGLARTKNLDGPWTLAPQPILPSAEQIENTSLYFEETNKTWFLFTNHVGVRGRSEYTDAVWVYWTRDLERWDPAHKAVVLDGKNCAWSKTVIGLPSVVRRGDRLALFYDGQPDPNNIGHMKRDVGLAWLDLPLRLPE